MANGVLTYSGSYEREDRTVHFVFFAFDKTVSLWTEEYPEADCVLPSDLKRIEKEAFKGCAFVCVKISDGVISIGERAFADSAALSCVFIPGSVTDIHASAFDEGSGLTIFGKLGSEAAAYASAHAFTLVPIE